MAEQGIPGRIIVVGTGLIGTSIALAMRERGAEVLLSDRDEAALRLAVELGAGEALPDGGPGTPADLAVLAVPPAAVAVTLLDAQKRRLAAVYTDVASVKALPLEQAAGLGCDLATFVAGHPLMRQRAVGARRGPSRSVPRPALGAVPGRRDVGRRGHHGHRARAGLRGRARRGRGRMSTTGPSRSSRTARTWSRPPSRPG